MLEIGQSIYSLVLLLILTFVKGVSYLSKGRLNISAAFRPLWILLLVITVAEWVSFSLALWLLAIISFCALREYLSLVDIRLEDRWGILVSYLSIPFMFYLIHIDWYGFFIIAIPVYAFLLMPFFVALGGRSKGIVFSVGMLDFGLFFYVFCVGHLGYLLFYSARMTLLMVVAVAISDGVYTSLKSKSLALRMLLRVAIICPLYVGLNQWTGIPLAHSVMLGILIPISVCLGRFTLHAVEQDLGIRADRLQPGRGRTIEGLKSYLYTAPIVFHYLRWFLKWGDLL
jgi:phosphatidate cytidylyltransferase